MRNNISQLINILNELQNKKVLVIGDIILDEYLYGEVKKVSSGIKIPIIEQKEKKHSLGGAGNVAANISGISNNVTIITKIANDDSGKEVIRLLNNYGIDSKIIEVEKTIKKQRVYVDNQQVARIDENFFSHTDSKQVKALLNQIVCDVIVVSDYQYGMIDARVLEKCKEKSLIENVPLFFTSREIENYDLTGITAVSINENEAEKFKLDKKYSYKITSCKNSEIDLFVTLGKKGIYANIKGEDFYMETEEIYPVNVSGAGDTVIAMISLLYGSGINIQDILKLANLSARIAIANKLTYRVTKEEIQTVLYETEIQNEYSSKIITCSIAANIVKAWQAKGKKVVLTNGCYDLLHLGHIYSFCIAKKMGDKLIVAVNSDDSIKRLKGENRPINTLEERVTTLSFLDMIDMIIVFEEDTAINVIKALNPDIYAKGEEYKNKTLLEAEYVKKLEYIPMIQGISTTNVLKKIEDILEA